MVSLSRYCAALSVSKTVLWCYLIWYLNTVFHYFDPTPAIWLNSLGISAIVGFALLLGVGGGAQGVDAWQTFRLFVTPFCVSSFSSLIKGKGFILIMPPARSEQILAVGLCVAFVALVRTLRWLHQAPPADSARD